MNELEAARRLVKSAPELWETCSDPDALSRHLDAFGEIRITRLEPETTVAWEGETASGTVNLEPSGWGTKVTLRARAVTGMTTEMPAAVAPEALEPEPRQPALPTPPVVTVRRRQGGLLGRLRGLFGSAQAPLALPQPARTPTPVPQEEWPEPPEAVPDTLAALEAALDSLGAAHHRPFSRG